MYLKRIFKVKNRHLSRARLLRMKDLRRVALITMGACWCSRPLFCGLSSTGSREVLARHTGTPNLRCPRNGRRMECAALLLFHSWPLALACWEGWQKDDSPSPDTGQHGLPAFCAGMFAQCRRVGWVGRFLADFSCLEFPRQCAAWRHFPAPV